MSSLIKKGVGYKRGVRLRRVISYDYSVNAWSGLHYGVLVAQWLAHMPFTASKLLDEAKHEYRRVYFPRERGKLALRRVAQCSHQIKNSILECCQFDSTKHRRFSPGTSVSFCTNAGPMRDGPYWTSKENSLVMTF